MSCLGRRRAKATEGQRANNKKYGSGHCSRCVGCLVAERLPSAANLGWVGWRAGRNRYYYYEERNETEAALIKGPPPSARGVTPGTCTCSQSRLEWPGGQWAFPVLHAVSLDLLPRLGSWALCNCQSIQPWGPGRLEECERVLPFSTGTCNVHSSYLSLFHSSLINPTPSRLLFASCLFFILSCTQPFPPIERPPIASTSSFSPFSIKHLLQNGRTPSKAGHCW